MAAYTWLAGSGAFSTASNWGPSGVPGVGDSATFYSGSYTISGNGLLDALTVAYGFGTGVETFSGSLSANNFTIHGYTAVAPSGTWTVTGPSGNISTSGTGLNATLEIDGTVTATSASQPTSFGLYAGGHGADTGSGVVNVFGPSAHLDTGVNGAVIGQTGTGALNVYNGATVVFTGDVPAGRPALVAGLMGPDGLVNVSGNPGNNVSASVVANGAVSLGHRGSGRLFVLDLGTFTGGSAASGATPATGITIGDGSATIDATGTPGNTTLYGGEGLAKIYRTSTLTSLGDLRVGYDGTAGRLEVFTSSTATSAGQIMVGGGTDHANTVGTLLLQTGGTVRSGGTHTTGVAGVVLGSDATTTGNVSVSDTGSVLDANGDRMTVGNAGTGILAVTAGGKVLAGSAGYSDREAALALGASAGGAGTITIDGAGSQLIATGDAVIGGNELNGVVTRGGTAVVTVTNGGLLQAAFMTVLTGSTVTVDASSTLTVPNILINGGTVTLNSLASTTITFGDTGILGLTALSGANAITTFKSSDKIDLLGITNATLANNVVTVGSATLSLSGSPVGATYALSSDGHGGTFVSVSAANAAPIPTPIPVPVPAPAPAPAAPIVSRFFSSIDGGHFFTNDPTEIATLTTPGSSSYRADLKLETGGFGAIAAAAARTDPSSTLVYRFFDGTTGAHFFTSSASERDSITNPLSSNYQPNYVYEPGSTFYEHGTKQTGDVAVYRFFDSADGTHFYTGDQNEYNQITAKGTAAFRSDLIAEGVAFYAPANAV